jgi:glycosyltransferase involved in cell wall biosynthesis
MIVRNEERSLQSCLDSVQGLADELVIVDTGSTDSTPHIAAHNGAKVIPFDFTFVDFAAARNQSLAQATGKWILVLDADETLDRASFVIPSEDAGYYVERHNPATIDHAIRLFPNRPEYRYRGRVHETLDAAILAAGGRLRRSNIRIHHAASSDPENRRRKNHWYIEILKQEIAADPTDHSRLDFLAAEYHQLEMFDEAAAVAERIVNARPLDATAHLNAGIYHLVYQANAPRARADFEQALTLRPGYPEALSFLETIESHES